MTLIAHMIYGYSGPLEHGSGFYSNALIWQNYTAKGTPDEVAEIYAGMNQSLKDEAKELCSTPEKADLCHVQSFSFQFIN